jgi:hypothetical protein
MDLSSLANAGAGNLGRLESQSKNPAFLVGATVEKIKLGLIVGVSDDPTESFERVAELAIPTCQIVTTAERFLAQSEPR